MEEKFFMQNLCESPLIQSKARASYFSFDDICDLIYLHLLAIQILKHEPNYKTTVAKYCADTLKYGLKFDTFNSSSTDLAALFTIAKDPDGYALKEKHLSNRLVNIPWQQIGTFLRNTAKGRIDTNFDVRFLFALDGKMGINVTNYKSIRRLVSEWDQLPIQSKKLAITRLLQAIRYRAGKSTIRNWLDKLAREQRLEITNAHNPEAVGSHTYAERDKQEAERAVNKTGNFMKDLAVAAAGVLGGYLAMKKLTDSVKPIAGFVLVEHMVSRINLLKSKDRLTDMELNAIIEQTSKKYNITEDEVFDVFEQQMGMDLAEWLNSSEKLDETTSGATGAGNIATYIGGTGGLGAGFDPDGDTWPYPKNKKTRKNKKSAPIIKRNM